VEPSLSASALTAWLTECFAAKAGISVAEVDIDAPLERYEIDSVKAVGMLAELSDLVGWSVTPSVLIEHETLRAMAEYLAG